MIIAVANQKGGVAKTTCTHNLGVALANKGKKILLIDFDSQASLTISVGLEPVKIENNIVSLMKKSSKSVSASDCIEEIKPNLHIITSIIDLAQLETELMSRTSREKILSKALENIKTEYDFILIDCPPQLSILTINALSCADGVIIPVKTDYLAYRGLEQLGDTISEIKELVNPGLKEMGLIATLFESRAKDDNDILEGLKKRYNVLGVIKRMTIAKKGIYDGLSVVESSPSSDLALEYRRIAYKIESEAHDG